MSGAICAIFTCIYSSWPASDTYARGWRGVCIIVITNVSLVILVPMRRRVSLSYEEAAAICDRAPTRLSKLMSIDSAEIFGQGHTTRPF